MNSINNWSFIGSLGGYCGGSIIGDSWFLTAGHCCASTPIGRKIYFGTANPWHDSWRVERTVKQYVIHPDFHRPTLHRDLCVIKLNEPLIFSEKVKPICLSEIIPDVSSPAFVAGWGLTSEGGRQSEDLMEVSVPVVDHMQCKAAYPTKLVDQSMICAGIPTGGMDGCQGDSGGPMAVVDMDGKVKLAGVVSWGVGCARPGLFGVYSTVHNAIDFIRDAILQMGGNFDKNSEGKNLNSLMNASIFIHKMIIRYEGPANVDNTNYLVGLRLSIGLHAILFLLKDDRNIN